MSSFMKTYIVGLLLITTAFLLPHAPGSAADPSPANFKFTLPAESSTSAGIYDSNGVLKRTLWSRLRYLAGEHTSSWDGKDDFGSIVTASGLTVKVLCNDVHYIWEGTIGNTSATFNGNPSVATNTNGLTTSNADTLWRSGTNQIESLSISGSDAFVGMGYNEGGGQIRRFTTTNPQVAKNVKGFTLATDFHFVATDSNRVYAATIGSASYNLCNYTFVNSYDISTNTQHAFSSTQTNITLNPKNPTYPDTNFPSCIDVFRTGSVGLNGNDEVITNKSSLYGVAYGTGKYAAVGANGIVITSSNSGATWTAVNALTSHRLTSIVYGAGKFIAVGEGGDGGEPTVVQTSSDGSTWTVVNPLTTKDLFSITYGGGIYVAVGEDGTVLTSSDGNSWTIQTSGIAGDLLGVTYATIGGSNLYVAVGVGGQVYTSSNGAVWTNRISGTANDLCGVTYGSTGGFVAVGRMKTILSSTDGITWLTRSIGTLGDSTSVKLYGVNYIGGKYVATGIVMGTTVASTVSEYLGNIMTSTNAISWSTVSYPGTSPALTSAASSNGSDIVAVGWAQSLVKYNSSTSAWTTATSGQTDGGAFDAFLVHETAATGIAVQSSGSLLAVAHGQLDAVLFFNKNTGNPVTSGPITSVTISVNTPTGISFSASGDLWILSKTASSKIYRYNSNSGTPVLADTVTTTLVTSPLVIAAHPTIDNYLLIGNDSTQQFVLYSSGTHALVGSPLGTVGGYTSSGPSVSNTKFSIGKPLAFASDGSFWVYDNALERLMHFSSGGTYIEQIMYHLNNPLMVDLNDPSRVFSGFTEYRIDYSKPLLAGDATASVGNGSWTPVRNWAASIPMDLNATSSVQNRGFSTVFDVSGHTYALIGNTIPGTNAILELNSTAGTATAVTCIVNGTSKSYLDSFNSIYADGSLRYGLVDYGTNIQNMYKLPGFVSGGVLTWGSPTLIASTPAASTDPVFSQTYGGIQPWQLPITSSGIVAWLSSQQSSTIFQPGWALGGANMSSSGWLWRASPRTLDAFPLDGMGSFNVGFYDGSTHIYSYPSDVLMSDRRSLIYGFHGEFWAGQSQADQLMHFYDDGLFVGQFGTSGDMVGINSTYTPGKAGNNLSPNLVRNGQDLYLYSADESNHGGPQRWRIAGNDSIYELSGAIASGQASTSTTSLTATPTAPYALRAAAGPSSVKLSWQNPTASGLTYNILKATSPTGPYSAIVTGLVSGTTSYTATSLSNDTTYFFKVSNFLGSNQVGTSEEVQCMPFAVATKVHLLGNAAYLSNLNTYRMDLKTAHLSDGQFPLTLHSMFEGLKADANKSLSRLSVGSAGYILYNAYTDGSGVHYDVSEPLGSNLSRSGDWANVDNYLAESIRVDNGTTITDYNRRGVGVSTQSDSSKVGAITITPIDSSWYMVTVFMPDIFSNPRNYRITAQAGGDSVNYTVDQTNIGFNLTNDGGGQQGLNGVHQLLFKGILTLSFTELYPSNLGDVNASVQALFLDKVPTF